MTTIKYLSDDVRGLLENDPVMDEDDRKAFAAYEVERDVEIRGIEHDVMLDSDSFESYLEMRAHFERKRLGVSVTPPMLMAKG